MRSTLDTLAFEAAGVAIAGEHDHADPPQPDRPYRAAPGRGSRWSSPIRRRARSARGSFARSCPAPRSAPPPAPPTRCAMVAASDEPWAALGAASAARDLRLRGAARWRRGRRRTTSPGSSGSPRRAPSPPVTGPWRTTLVFSELGADHPGALVEALTEFSSRDVNLTRIESRPLRRGLGRYMFFCDLEGRRATTPRSPRGSRRSAARPSRCESSAATRSRRTACLGPSPLRRHGPGPDWTYVYNRGAMDSGGRPSRRASERQDSGARRSLPTSTGTASR